MSAMEMDSVIRLADITLPEGVTATADPDTTLVTVLFIRAEELESDAEAEAAEGEEAEGEEGAEGEGEAAEGEGAPADSSEAASSDDE